MVEDALLNQSLYLGSGGSSPQVCAIDPESDRSNVLAEFPLGHSVYSLARSEDGIFLAAGTKGGVLVVIDLQSHENTRNRVHQCIHGAPVLSTCFLNGMTLLSSDAAGRWFQWHRSKENEWRLQQTASAIVCSTASLSADRAVGLTVDGAILIWDLQQNALIHSVQVIPPSPISACVHLTLCDSTQKAAYPSRSGDLIVYHFQEDRAQALAAHNGEWYAMDSWDNRIITAGMYDHVVKVWDIQEEEIIKEYSFPGNPISIRLIRDDGRLFHIIDRNGSAGIYEVNHTQLSLIDRSTSSHYRTALRPSIPELRKNYQQKRHDEAYSIAKQIESGIRNRRWEHLEESHSRLHAIGYSHISLALQAKTARQQNDLLRELRCRHQLVKILTRASSRSRFSDQRFAEILVSFWQIETASAIYQRINDPISFTNLQPYLKSMQRGGWMIESEHPVSTLIQAAAIIEKPFQGRWIMKALNSFSFPENSLNASTIGEKYEQIREESKELSLPNASLETVEWVSKPVILEGMILRIQQPNFNLSACEFGLFIHQQNLQTIFTPVVLFFVPSKPDNISILDFNQRILRIWEELQAEKSGNLWFAKVHQTILLALRRLKSESTRPVKTI